MKRARLVLAPVVTLAAVVPALAFGGALAAASATAATTCLGKPVTIVASQEVTTGTEGDDVVAMTPGAWNGFDALGGNDTLCLALPRAVNGRDPIGRVGYVRAGAGDDVVVNETVDGEGRVTVLLGTGNDTFTGSAAMVEAVYADSHEEDALGRPPAGGQRDVISMGGGRTTPPEDLELSYGSLPLDTVYSAAPLGELNADEITFGPGSAVVHYRGAMAPEGRLDFSAASTAALYLPYPGEGDPMPGGELRIDNAARRATVGDAQVLTWTGHVRTFELGLDEAPQWPYPVSFVGSDADEVVAFPNGRFGDVRLGGGNDRLGRRSPNRDEELVQVRSADGGPGTDIFAARVSCRTLTIRMASRSTCDGTTTPFEGFEDLLVNNQARNDRVLVLGTPAADTVRVAGDRVTFRGRDGADDAWGRGRVVRLDGGRGPDRLTGVGYDVVVRGGSGADRIRLDGSRRSPRRLVGAGGPGRDHCDAEVTRRCERG